MPSSGGSVSDAPVNKVMNGQSHYLAYITPDEGKTLEKTGSVVESTPQGIPSYGGHRGGAEKTAAAGGVGAQGEGPTGGEGPEKGGYETYMAPVDVTERYTSPEPVRQDEDTPSQVIEQTRLDIEQGAKPPGEVGGPGPTYEEQQIFADWDTKPNDQKQEIIDKALNEFEQLPQVDYISNDDKSKISKIIIDGGLLAFNLLKDNLLGAFTGIAKAFIPFSDLSSAASKKAMTWSLESRLKSIQNQKDFHPGAYGYKISDIQSDLEGIEDGTFTQRDFTAKYGSGDTSNPLDASYIPPTGDERTANENNGLVNVITPNVTGGTTPVNSMAAQWYAGLGNGPSNPGAFNLTTQYATAKAAVSQRLGSPTSIGQLAVNQSPFYNWLKGNSLDKGIL